MLLLGEGNTRSFCINPRSLNIYCFAFMHLLSNYDKTQDQNMVTLFYSPQTTTYLQSKYRVK